MTSRNALRMLVIATLFFCGVAFPSQKVADIANSWYRCAPPNPFNPHEACKAACCGNNKPGDNWDLTCIGFVEEAARMANGRPDPDLLKGFPKPGVKFGSAIEAYAAMVRAGRAHGDASKMPPGAAVFFFIRGFTPGHITIYSGHKDALGNPLIVTTGGPKAPGIRLVPLSVLASEQFWTYLGWADI